MRWLRLSRRLDCCVLSRRVVVIRRLVDTWSDFDGGDFAVIEPDQVAVGAGIDDDIPGPVVRMNMHAFFANGARHSSLEFLGVEWDGGGVNFLG